MSDANCWPTDPELPTLQSHSSRACSQALTDHEAGADWHSEKKNEKKKGAKNFFDAAETMNVPLQMAAEPSAQST
jgi:hypothetical protein